MLNTNTDQLVQQKYRSREANLSKITSIYGVLNRNMSTGMIEVKKFYIFLQDNKGNDSSNVMVYDQVVFKSVHISTKFLHSSKQWYWAILSKIKKE